MFETRKQPLGIKSDTNANSYESRQLRIRNVLKFITKIGSASEEETERNIWIQDRDDRSLEKITQYRAS